MLPGCLCVSTQLLVSDDFLKGAGLVLELNHSVATVRMFIVDVPVPVPMIYERLEMRHRSSVPFDRLRIDTVEDASRFVL